MVIMIVNSLVKNEHQMAEACLGKCLRKVASSGAEMQEQLQ